MFCLEVFWRFVKLLRDFQCLMEYLTEELFSEAATIRKIMLHQISEGRVKTRLIFWSVNWKNWILEIVFFDEKILKNFLIKKKKTKKKTTTTTTTIFVSLSLSKDKIFVNISSCWLCSKQISEKIKWHQLISKGYVIKTSSAYQDGMIV